MTDGNKSAHPQFGYDGNNSLGYPTHKSFGGLTKREAFAMAAMQGLLASGRCNLEEVCADGKFKKVLYYHNQEIGEVINKAVECTIEALNAKKEEKP